MKDRAWNYATAIVVLLILFNPELLGLALFVDAIGLELFIMLLQIQALAMALSFFHMNVKPVIETLACSYSKVCRAVSRKNCEPKSDSLLILLPSQSTVMHFLVLSVAVDMVCHAY